MTAPLPNKVGFRREHTGDPQADRMQAQAQQTSMAHEQTKAVVKALANYAWLDLLADTTISSASLVDLFPAPLTIKTTLATGNLIIEFSTSFAKSAVAGTIVFVVTVDGVDTRGAATSPAASADGQLSILLRVPVKAGTHTVKVRCLSNAGSFTIAAKTVPLNAYASLRVQEAA